MVSKGTVLLVTWHQLCGLCSLHCTSIEYTRVIVGEVTLNMLASKESPMYMPEFELTPTELGFHQSAMRAG